MPEQKEIELDLTFKPSYKPSLFDIHKAFDVIETDRYKGIKGEYYNRMVVFTSFVLAKNCVILEGPRSSGKSNVIDVTSKFCREAKLIDKASEKADYRDHLSLNEASHFIIPEVNKVSESFKETMKDIGEGKKSQYKYLDEMKVPRKISIDPKPFITSRADENDNVLGEELISR